MTLAEIKQALHNALPIRIPQFDPNESPGKKIEALESHILKCAWHRAELEEALHWSIEAGKRLRREWDRVEGYQVAIRGSKPTKEQIDLAKAELKPDLWDSLQESRTLVSSLQRQITRLGGSDYEAASRAYTFISGS